MNNITNTCSNCGKIDKNMAHPLYCIRCEQISHDIDIDVDEAKYDDGDSHDNLEEGY